MDLSKLFKEIKPEQLTENPFKRFNKDWTLITAKKDDKVNTMTASWGGVGIMWNKNVAFIVIRPQRYTKEFVDASETFSLSFYDDEYKKKLSYLGTVSGRYEDKIKNVDFTIAQDNNTPFFTEANTVLICKKLLSTPFTEQDFIDKSLIDKNYPSKDFHTLYIAEIEKVLVKNN